MFSFDPPSYGPVVAQLLADDRLPELGPGQPNAGAYDHLRALSAQQILPSVSNTDMAQCCVAGLWLWHDYLDESHTISQGISSATGSLWHGIMHRREPDYSNAKYWYRRVGDHEIFPALRDVAAELTQSQPADGSAAFLRNQPHWDPFAFVDLCSAVAQGTANCELLCRKVARAEWQLLFDYCYQQAT